MSRLTKNLYTDRNNPSDLFGLRDGQMRTHGKQMHNAQWHNLLGGNLGMGDLSLADMEAIADGLRPGEVFIALNEYAALELRGTYIGDQYRQAILQRARYIIVPGTVYRVNEFDIPGTEPRTDVEICEKTDTIIEVIIVPSSTARELLVELTAQAATI